MHKTVYSLPPTLLILLGTPKKKKKKKKMAASITGSNSSTRPGYYGLKPISPNKMDSSKASSVAWKSRSVSNGSKIHCMKTWTPINNTKYETLSYLPPLSDESIAKQIDYMISKGWIPCLEFDEVGKLRRENSRIPGYYEGRYWTLWKLPMFGCNDASPVLSEIHHCRNAFPSAYIRCLGFDNERQVQCMAFLVQKPPSSSPS